MSDYYEEPAKEDYEGNAAGGDGEQVGESIEGKRQRLTAAEQEEKKKRKEQKVVQVEYYTNFENILDTYVFENDVERAGFLDSFYTELIQAIEENKTVLNNQVISRVVEKALRYSNETQLRTLFQALNGRFTALMTKPASAHLLETLLGIIPQVASGAQKHKNVPGEALPTLPEIVDQLLDEIQDELATLIEDKFASFVLRSMFKMLAGKPVKDMEPPEDSKGMFFTYLKRLTKQ
eukprot:gene23277-1427_t